MRLARLTFGLLIPSMPKSHMYSTPSGPVNLKFLIRIQSQPRSNMEFSGGRTHLFNPPHLGKNPFLVVSFPRKATMSGENQCH